MRRRTFSIVALAVVAALAACQKLGPDPAAEQTAKLAYQHLIRHEDNALDAMFIPQARNPRDHEMFDRIRTLIPQKPLQKTTLVNWQSYVGTTGHTLTYQHTYDYGGGDVVTATSVLTPQPSGGWMLQGFNVNSSFVPAPAAASKPAG